MFTIPHNTTVYLLKEPIDMRYGMYRLQGVIAKMLRRPMPKDSFYFFINRGGAEPAQRHLVRRDRAMPLQQAA